MKSSASERDSPQVHEDPQHLGAHAHVEHRDRLVADQALGVEHERGGDGHALALAAGQLVRVAVAKALGREADVGQRAVHARGVLGGRRALDDQRLGHDRPHAHARVERLVRVLEDHLHAPPQRPPFAPAGDRGAVELERPARRADQAEHRPRERRLPAARLAHHAEHLAGPPVERDAVDGARRAVVHVQVANADHHDSQGAKWQADDCAGATSRSGGSAAQTSAA